MKEEEQKGTQGKLTPRTWVPLGLATIAIFSVSGGAVWLNRSLDAINFKLESLSATLGTVKAKVETFGDGYVTKQELRALFRILQAKNQTLDIPLPD